MKKRPNILSILFILSILGSVYEIIFGLFLILSNNIINSNNNSSNLITDSNSINPIPNINVTILTANKLSDYSLSLGPVVIFTALICLLGIILMWKHQKKGFYLYVFGELASPIATILLMGFGLGIAFNLVEFAIPVIMTILWG